MALGLDEALEAARDCVEVGVVCTPGPVGVLLSELDRARAQLVALGLQLDTVAAVGSAAITQLDEAQAEIERLRAAPREHCESCYWSGDDEMCSAAS